MVLLTSIDQNHDELVATETRHGITRTNTCQQASSDFDDHLVTHIVAETVVDVLEAIQVDKQDRQRLLGWVRLPRLLNRHGQPVHHEAAIGQPGQVVMTGQMTHAVFRRLAFGYILDSCDEMNLTATLAH
jgi:hypothetical protein